MLRRFDGGLDLAFRVILDMTGASTGSIPGRGYSITPAPPLNEAHLGGFFVALVKLVDFPLKLTKPFFGLINALAQVHDFQCVQLDLN